MASYYMFGVGETIWIDLDDLSLDPDEVATYVIKNRASLFLEAILREVKLSPTDQAECKEVINDYLSSFNTAG